MICKGSLNPFERVSYFMNFFYNLYWRWEKHKKGGGV